MKKLIYLSLFVLILFSAGFVQAKTFGYTLQWDPNSEADLAGYKIYVGTESRVYGNAIVPAGGQALATTYEGTLDVPDDTRTTYYFAVTAYDTSDLESDYSNEVSHEFDTRVAPAPPQNLRWFERLIAWIKKHLRFVETGLKPVSTAV